MFLSEWNSFVPAVAINFSLSETLNKCCEILPSVVMTVRIIFLEVTSCGLVDGH